MKITPQILAEYGEQVGDLVQEFISEISIPTNPRIEEVKNPYSRSSEYRVDLTLQIVETKLRYYKLLDKYFILASNNIHTTKRQAMHVAIQVPEFERESMTHEQFKTYFYERLDIELHRKTLDEYGPILAMETGYRHVVYELSSSLEELNHFIQMPAHVKRHTKVIKDTLTL